MFSDNWRWEFILCNRGTRIQGVFDRYKGPSFCILSPKLRTALPNVHYQVNVLTVLRVPILLCNNWFFFRLQFRCTSAIIPDVFQVFWTPPPLTSSNCSP